MTRSPLNRAGELGWMFGGFLTVQLALAVGLEGFWPDLRDPEFDKALAVLERRRLESPGRPLTLALGSSRTQSAVRGDYLSEATGKLVFNFGVPGSGPMMQQTVLRRLIERGIRPEVVLIEAMPMSFANRGGTPL